jgi:SAM-dependent methyltransferase
MSEINLMAKYPKTKRNINEREVQRTKDDIQLAKQFGKEYFDGERRTGYGGYYYHERFWTNVVQDFIEYYKLTKDSKILDVGCGKGFMLFDFMNAIPGITVKGIDISQYAIDKAKEEVKEFLQVGNAKDLSMFKDKEFDLVISITTIHNLKLEDCKQALREIQRVGKNAFITNDAWRTEEEKERMHKWNLTAETFMSTDDWEKLFNEVGYTGDYYWFIA